MLSSCNYFAWSTNTPWFQIYIWYRSDTETLHKQQSSIQTNHHKIDKKCSQDCHWKASASVLALCAVGNPKLGGLIMKPNSDFIWTVCMVDVWWQSRLTKSTAEIVISFVVLGPFLMEKVHLWRRSEKLVDTWKIVKQWLLLLLPCMPWNLKPGKLGKWVKYLMPF